MAEPAAASATAGKVVIRNVGLMLSGDMDRPILDADTVVAVDGLITAVGKDKDCDTAAANTIIDARGCALGARPDRQPRASGVRRLDAAAEPARLDRRRSSTAASPP